MSSDNLTPIPNITKTAARRAYEQIRSELQSTRDIIRGYAPTGDTAFSVSVSHAAARDRNLYYQLVASIARWEQLIIERGWGMRNQFGDFVWS